MTFWPYGKLQDGSDASAALKAYCDEPGAAALWQSLGRNRTYLALPEVVFQHQESPFEIKIGQVCNANRNDDEDDKKRESCQRPLVRGKNRFKEEQNWHVKDIEAVRDSTQMPKKTIFEKPLEHVLLRCADNQDRGQKVYYAISPEELPILEQEFWVTQA